MEIESCPCCSGKTYEACCAPLIRGDTAADSPEALMRSRYTAYSQANIPYIQQTMKSPASDNYDPVEAKKWAESIQWLGLDVLNHSMKGDQGLVEFIATFILHGQKQSMREISEFRRDAGKWYYIKGIQPVPKPITSTSIGRNDPCTCGSGKKYKKCCGR